MKSSNYDLKAVLKATAVGFGLLGIPAVAETPQSTTAFDQQVRDALLRNPEIILEVFALLEQKEVAAKAVKDQDLIASVADDLFVGLDPEKPILVEFQDYNCGYCRKSHATVPALREEMPDLQFVTMEMPILNEGSKYTAQAALALKELEGPEAYQTFANAMMGGTEPANVTTVLQTLTDLGFDTEAVVQAVKDGKGADELQRARDLADALGVTGTPYFIGPAGISRGAASLEQLKALSTYPTTES